MAEATLCDSAGSARVSFLSCYSHKWAGVSPTVTAIRSLIGVAHTDIRRARFKMKDDVDREAMVSPGDGKPLLSFDKRSS